MGTKRRESAKSILKNKEDELLHRQRRMEKIKDYILANLASDLSIAIVSKQFEMSASTLKRFFKKNTKHSYHYYVNEMRMKKALELISKGERIQQTMYATGYKYRSSFNKAFKKKFKHPPGFYSL